MHSTSAFQLVFDNSFCDCHCVWIFNFEDKNFARHFLRNVKSSLVIRPSRDSQLWFGAWLSHQHADPQAPVKIRTSSTPIPLTFVIFNVRVKRTLQYELLFSNFVVALLKLEIITRQRKSSLKIVTAAQWQRIRVDCRLAIG